MVAGSLVDGIRGRGLTSQNGIVGVHTHKAVQTVSQDWPDHGMLIMHSDGISTRWTLEAYPGLWRRHPAVVAGVLYRDFARGRDDATVVVVRVPTGWGQS